MDTYWAYEDEPTSHARIHRADCRFCNYGSGLNGGGTGQNSTWHGPFSSAQEAGAACHRYVPHGCHWCLPNM